MFINCILSIFANEINITMRVSVLILCLALVFGTNAKAQTTDANKFDFMDKSSASLDDVNKVKDKVLREEGIRPFVDSYKALTNKESEFNKGEEPFKEFIRKFMTDKDFRDERIVLSAEQVEEYKTTEHSYLFCIKLDKIDEGIHFSGWTEMSADETHFMNGWIFGEAQDHSTFNRSGGLWYLTDYVTFNYNEEEGE